MHLQVVHFAALCVRCKMSGKNCAKFRRAYKQNFEFWFVLKYLLDILFAVYTVPNIFVYG